MRYNLLLSNRGFMAERQSIFCDLEQDIELSFSLPEGVETAGCELVVTFTDKDGGKHQQYIKNGNATIPQWLIKPQVLAVDVTLCKENTPLRIWRCEPIRLANFNEACENVFEVYPELKTVPEEIVALNDIVSTQAGRITDMEAEQSQSLAEIALLKENNARLAAALEDVVKQVALIESNYNIVETIKEEN